MGAGTGKGGLNQGGAAQDLVGHGHRGTVDRDVDGVRQDRRAGPSGETSRNVTVRRAESEQHHIAGTNQFCQGRRGGCRGKGVTGIEMVHRLCTVGTERRKETVRARPDAERRDFGTEAASLGEHLQRDGRWLAAGLFAEDDELHLRSPSSAREP